MDYLLPSVYAACFLVVLYASFKLLRPYFPVTVHCWFCNYSVRVPYGNRNCWDCPSCEQYNGFNDEGDYNKPIPAQFEENLNHPVTASQVSKSGPSSKFQLCNTCQRNQQLKVKQIANFSPTCEANFDSEAEAFKQKMEVVYKLCSSCESSSRQEIRRQNRLLQASILRFKCEKKLQSAPHSQNADNEVGFIQGLLNSVELLAAVAVILHVFHYMYPMIASKYLIHKDLTWYNEIVKNYISHLHAAAIVLQILTISLRYKTSSLGMLHVTVMLVWLLSYCYVILSAHALLSWLTLPTEASAFLSCILLLLRGYAVVKGLRTCHVSSPVRPSSPAISDAHSILSASTDSGVSATGTYVSAGTCRNVLGDDLMRTSVGLSSLSLGSPPVARSTYAGSVATHRSSRTSIIKPAGFSPAPLSRPVYSPSQRSPGSISSYYSTPSNHLSSRSAVYSNVVPCEQSPLPPLASSYQSITSSPNSPSLCSHPYSSFTTVAAQPSASLTTQILLGISLGINISIVAFLMGRYTVNWQIFSSFV